MKRTNALEEKSQPASQACLLAHAFATAPTIPAVHLSMSALSFCITLCSPRTEKQGWTIMFATASGMGHVRHPSRVVSYVRYFPPLQRFFSHLGCATSSWATKPPPCFVSCRGRRSCQILGRNRATPLAWRAWLEGGGAQPRGVMAGDKASCAYVFFFVYDPLSRFYGFILQKQNLAFKICNNT